jgi:hypothetical protein
MSPRSQEPAESPRSSDAPYEETEHELDQESPAAPEAPAEGGLAALAPAIAFALLILAFIVFGALRG